MLEVILWSSYLLSSCNILPKVEHRDRVLIQIIGPGTRGGFNLPGWAGTELCVELGQERFPARLLHVCKQQRAPVMQEADASQQQVEGRVCLQKLQLSCVGLVPRGVSAHQTLSSMVLDMFQGGRFAEKLLHLRFRKAASACYKHSHSWNMLSSNLGGEKHEATPTCGGIKGLTGLLQARLTL